MSMTDRELAALIDHAERDSVSKAGEFNETNETLFKYYMGEPFGDEMEGRSQVISTDVFDVVESDMPSLARVFLGGSEIAEFKPMTDRGVTEAEQKNKLIPWLIRNVPNSFRIQHGWIKDALIQKIGVLEYGVRDERRTEIKHYDGLTELSLVKLISELRNDPDISNVEIVGRDIIDDDEGAKYEVKIKLTHGKLCYFMEGIPNEDFIISRNAASKDDADIVGKRFRKSRGDLIAEGFDEDEVRRLPSVTTDDDSSAKQVRYKTQGGEDEDPNLEHWANELVQGVDVYVKVDWDEDGIPERRHVIKSGKIILENEPFDHVPYAITSAMLMPHNVIGRSRAEISKTTQRVQSVLTRNVLDNIYSVNNTGMVVNDEIIEVDDLLTQRPNRVVRSNGSPQGQWQPIETPYIGDKALQVIQYMDSKQARSSGSMLTNQGLDADQLHKETATRFTGVKDASTAKIELVARVIAETGYKDLYEGMAWYASHFQDSELEVFVLGETLKIDPSTWKQDHYVEVLVGTGAGDSERTLETLGGIYSIQKQLKDEGSPLVDDAKLYNTLARIVKTSGLNRVDRYYNDPEVPLQIILRENELLKQAVANLQAQLENPLAEAEKVKQQGSIVRDQMKYRHENQLKAVDTVQKEKDRQAKVYLETAEMELTHNEDLPGGL